MKTRKLIALLLVILLLGQPVGAAGLTEEQAVPTEVSDWSLDATGALISTGELDLDGEAILLYEMNSHALVYGKNLDARRYPASLTKVMTCLLAIESGNMDAEVPVTQSALSTMDPDGSAADLWPGEVYTLRQLLYCLMVKSANDAALVIAEYLGGSQEGFVEMMNQRAQELGCTGTHYMNPHGMHDPNHYTTARDLAKITQAALQYDLFRELYSTTSYTLPETESRAERTLYSTNYLISTDLTDQYYDSRVLGGKTGFTTPAGRCVICTAADDASFYLAVVLGAQGLDAEGNAVYGGFTTASALFDACLGRYGLQEAAASGATIEVPVKFGDSAATLYTRDSIQAFLPYDYDPSRITTQAALYNGGLTAPVSVDQEVGILKLQYGYVTVGTAFLYSSQDIAYVEPVYPARESRAPGRFPMPLGQPWNRMAYVM